MDEILYQSKYVAECYGRYRASMIRARWSKADSLRFEDIAPLLRTVMKMHARFARIAHRDYLFAVKKLRRVVADQLKDESHVQTST